ncbi:hypothetical protein [Anaerosalibacter massiliensis]|uniref:DUF5659 domain-containing protein n=1 Tax=Anaerosalibacter massiliensis TaxID=1347392 RepID=A0A9X2MEQ0_9FIRM|nr:hypothetical protein [Anaerosalibacter massiliensis]MCR2042620.1 hypothetical protein [Anaerosalibacter massiliensis]
MKKCITVFEPAIARKLLKEGYTIVDIKPDKFNKIKTLFVFKNERNLIDRIYEISDENKSH